MKITELRDKHRGEAAFCLGTAPHLDKLDLTLLKGQVTIGCNQLVDCAEENEFDYLCFIRDERFRPVREQVTKLDKVVTVIPENLMDAQHDWALSDRQRERIVPINTRFTSPGHAEFFSFDLEICAYAGNVLALQVQLAAWMGCNPIYVLGVDACVADPEKPFCDIGENVEMDVAAASKYHFPELADWLSKSRAFLWPRGIRLLNAAGEYSALETLPKIRLRAAVGDPLIAVTSKTFCGDDYLVEELRRYFPRIQLNTSPGKLKGEELVAFLAEADGVILGTEPLSSDVLEQLPSLRHVSKYGVGLNNIDFEAAKRQNVDIIYRKGVNSDSVAELTVCLCLSLLRHVAASHEAYSGGRWAKLPGRELAEVSLGVVGYGHVGKVVAQKFAALGVGRLLVCDLIDFAPRPPAEFVPLDYLLEESDVVTLHVSMEECNRGMMNTDMFMKMKEGALLINTSRGDVVDEGALVDACTTGRLGGAALDVFETEPVQNPRLQELENVVTTCHIAGSSNRAIKNMGWAAIEGMLKLVGRKPVW